LRGLAGRKDSGDGKTQGEGTHAKGRTQDPPTRQRRHGEADEVAPKLAENWRAAAGEKGDAQDVSIGAGGVAQEKDEAENIGPASRLRRFRLRAARYGGQVAAGCVP
jgi:hypothetical protein